MSETTITGKNTAETIIDLMQGFGGFETIQTPPQPVNPVAPHLITLPNNRSVADLTSYHVKALELLKPLRRKGTAKIATLASLIAWANRFKAENSALYASPDADAPSLTCIANYHAQGPAPTDRETDPLANHGDHRAIYQFPLSNEWKRWKHISGRPMTREEMGQFIEDNAKDFMDPSPGLMNPNAAKDIDARDLRLLGIASKLDGRFGQFVKLLGMSRAFVIKETSDLTVSRNPNTGEQTLQFINEHKDADGAPLSIPDLFLIAIPVFNRGALYRLPIRFQYRKKGAGVTFTLSIYDPQFAFDDAFNEAISQAAKETGLPLFEGAPEV